MVAGERRILRLYFAASPVAIPRASARQPPAAAPGFGRGLVGRGRSGVETGALVCARAVPASELAASLLETLQVEPDDFWSWHFTFRSARLKKPQPLLGLTRVTDLAANVILPWLWIRAVEGKNQSVQRAIENRYFDWPPGQDNALLRLARQRLLGGAARRALTGAAMQQGLIQIVRDFCEHSNALCENCRFPELVREWNDQHQKSR